MTRTTAFLVALALAVSVSPLFAAGYRFILPSVDAQPGDSLRWTIQGDHEQAAQGFSLAARYPSADVTIERIHIEDTILEALNGQEGVDYFEKRVSPGEGIFAVGVLVDSRPPFDGPLIPSIGRPLAFLPLELRISQTARGTLKIRLENGLFSPPIDNLYSIDNRAVYLTELTEGAIRLPGGEGQGNGGEFLRGDFNMDSALDISDPIGILAYTFFGSMAPHCRVAGDANDDETIDISDPIYLLAYLFAHGPPPPPPASGTGGGLDPTPGELGCERSLGN